MRLGKVYILSLLASLALVTPGVAQDAVQDSLREQVGTLTDQLEGVKERLSVTESDVANLKKIKVSGYVQSRYEYHDDAISSPAQGTGSTASANQGKLLNRFFVRRGRFKITYQATPDALGVISIDGSASGVTLKDAFVTLTEPRSQLAFTLGQFNWPFGYEVVNSSSKREFPERPRWSRTLFPGERDRGIKAERTFTVAGDKSFNLQAGVFNGNGIDDRVFGVNDPNKHKDLVGRAGLGLGMLDLGVSGYWGRQFNPSDSVIPKQQPSTTDKIRYGADGQFYFELPKLGGGVIKGEIVSAEEPKNQSKAFLSLDSTRTALGYHILLAQHLHEKVQFISRLEHYDPDTDIDDDQFVSYGVGLIYYWDGNSKFKLVYEIPKPGENSRTGRIKGEGFNEDEKDNILTLEWVYSL